ncbi:MAG: caspase family protein [Rhizobiaceae bacterium]|nr:caspase family protein [Rhizobiaceae bacterium]
MQNTPRSYRSVSRFFSALVISLFLATGIYANAFSANRLALVIGNSDYEFTASLKNPANDAELIGGKLRDIGFDVLMKKDVNRVEIQQLINEFAQKIKEAGEDAIVLFYYAGHGIQFNGINYMVPVDADLKSNTDIILQGINASVVLKIIELSGAKTNIVVLDACRNNPFPAVSRAVGQGLARMDSPSGSFIAYSTAPGDVALDGEGKYSPYSAALAEFITEPDLTLEAMFKKVRRKVYFDTDKAQTTWESTSLIDEVYLVKKERGTLLSDTPALERPASVVKEENFWNQIRDKNDPQLFQTYLQMFPKGKNREIALAQLPRPDDVTKRIKPLAQKFEYTDEELEQRFAKFNTILELMKDSNILRAILSYDRYKSWCCKNLEKGPTGKERYISYGLYGLYYLDWEQFKIMAKIDEKTAQQMEQANAKPSTWMDKFYNLPLRKPAFDKFDNATAKLISAFITLHPIVQNADKYYNNELFQYDSGQGARKIHRELYPQFEKFIKAYSSLAAILLNGMDEIKAQEIDYIALKNGRSWEWYGIREDYYLTRFMLEFQRDAKLNKKTLQKAFDIYLANFLEISDYSTNAPTPPQQYAELMNSVSGRLKQMKDILKHKGVRKWSLDLDVGN